MKIAIVGSRHFKDYDFVENAFNSYRILLYESELFPIEIVSGGGTGVDNLAKELANRKHYKFKEFPPVEGVTFAQKCYNRNAQIVNYSDVILAFWDGRIEHCGTLLTMQLAAKAKKVMYVIGV